LKLEAERAAPALPSCSKEYCWYRVRTLFIVEPARKEAKSTASRRGVYRRFSARSRVLLTNHATRTEVSSGGRLMDYSRETRFRLAIIQPGVCRFLLLADAGINECVWSSARAVPAVNFENGRQSGDTTPSEPPRDRRLRSGRPARYIPIGCGQPRTAIRRCPRSNRSGLAEPVSLQCRPSVAERPLLKYRDWILSLL
jgi:hypothetical protein